MKWEFRTWGSHYHTISAVPRCLNTQSSTAEWTSSNSCGSAPIASASWTSVALTSWHGKQLGQTSRKSGESPRPDRRTLNVRELPSRCRRYKESYWLRFRRDPTGLETSRLVLGTSDSVFGSNVALRDSTPSILFWSRCSHFWACTGIGQPVSLQDTTLSVPRLWNCGKLAAQIMTSSFDWICLLGSQSCCHHGCPL